MKVILLLDVDKIGKKDEIVEVNDGYAKNYLIKNKLAVAVSKGTLESLAKRKQHESENDAQLRQQAEELKSKIEAVNFTFKLKCHENKVFGHISLKELLIEINKQFPTINKYMFTGKNHMWLLGKHQVEIKLYKDIIATINIDVIANNC